MGLTDTEVNLNYINKSLADLQLKLRTSAIY